MGQKKHQKVAKGERLFIQSNICVKSALFGVYPHCIACTCIFMWNKVISLAWDVTVIGQ